jgi:hypothetical protein
MAKLTLEQIMIAGTLRPPMSPEAGGDFSRDYRPPFALPVPALAVRSRMAGAA